jgi:hypothetical protein
MNWDTVIQRLYRYAEHNETNGDLTACRVLKHIGFALEDGLDAYRHSLVSNALEAGLQEEG